MGKQGSKESRKQGSKETERFLGDAATVFVILSTPINRGAKNLSGYPRHNTCSEILPQASSVRFGMTRRRKNLRGSWTDSDAVLDRLRYFASSLRPAFKLSKLRIVLSTSG